MKNRNQILIPPNMHTPMEGGMFQNYQANFKRQGYQNEKLVKEWSAIYYAMVTAADRAVGAVLKELDRLKVANHTLGK